MLIVPSWRVVLVAGPVDAGAIFAAGPVDDRDALLLLAIATAGGFGFRWTGIARLFFSRPLGLAAGASALHLPVRMPPCRRLASARILLGSWLGCMLEQALFIRAPDCLPTALASGRPGCRPGPGLDRNPARDVRRQGSPVQPPHRHRLAHHAAGATAPGSVTETALTAKLLQRGVVAVTAVHVARIVVIIPSASLLVLITARLAAKLQGAEGRGAEGRGKADRQASSQPPEPKTSCPFSLPPVAFARQRPVPTRARALLQAAAPAPSKSAQSPAVDHECCGIDWPSGRTKAHQRCTLRP